METVLSDIRLTSWPGWLAGC